MLLISLNSYFKVKCLGSPSVNSRPISASLPIASTLGLSLSILPCPTIIPSFPSHPQPWELLTYIIGSVDGSDTQGHLIVGKELPSACQGQMQTHKALSSKTTSKAILPGLAKCRLLLHLSLWPCSDSLGTRGHGMPARTPHSPNTPLLLLTPRAQSLPGSVLNHSLPQSRTPKCLGIMGD